mgnify:CR=1 FL=1
MRLKNILLVVENIEKSIAFYKELFGLKVLKDFDGNVILTEGLVLQDRKIWENLIEKEENVKPLKNMIILIKLILVICLVVLQ